jgi:hypothetical protein
MFMEYVIPAFNDDKEGILARADDWKWQINQDLAICKIL